jgi:hypothetical protein
MMSSDTKLKPVCLKITKLTKDQISTPILRQLPKHISVTKFAKKLVSKCCQTEKLYFDEIGVQTHSIRKKNSQVQTTAAIETNQKILNNKSVLSLQDYIHFCCNKCSFKCKEGSEFKEHLDADSHNNEEILPENIKNNAAAKKMMSPKVAKIIDFQKQQQQPKSPSKELVDHQTNNDDKNDDDWFENDCNNGTTMDSSSDIEELTEIKQEVDFYDLFSEEDFKSGKIEFITNPNCDLNLVEESLKQTPKSSEDTPLSLLKTSNETPKKSPKKTLKKIFKPVEEVKLQFKCKSHDKIIINEMDQLIDHIQIDHLEDDQFECSAFLVDGCYEAFDMINELKSHIEKTHRLKTTVTAQQLMTRKKKLGPRQDSGMFEGFRAFCAACDTTFQYIHTLILHLR